MLSNRFELFSILGFRVSLDFSWVFIAVLVTWSLATGWFPQTVPGIAPSAAWWLGGLGALGLFVSIILHELSHSLVARRFDIPITGITLFIFGGVAEMEKEPPNAKSEFFMAIAGPIMSFVLAGLFQLCALALADTLAAALFSYLALINGVLATFNLVPAFPLDGGRMFRAAMWGWTGDYARATRIAAALGRGFGTVLMLLGLFSLVQGDTISGIWQALLGFFILGAARSSEYQLSLESGLSRVTVGQIMTQSPITIPADTPLDTVAEDYFYRYHHKVFPVLRDGELLGCLRVGDIGRIPPAERTGKTAADALDPDRPMAEVPPTMPALDAMKQMSAAKTSRLLVTEAGRLKGMLTMRDILDTLAIRQELGAADRAA